MTSHLAFVKCPELCGTFFSIAVFNFFKVFWGNLPTNGKKVSSSLIHMCEPSTLRLSNHSNVEQGFSNVWCYVALEEVDRYLRSPTINF